MAYIGRTPQSGNFQVCDAIAVVDDQAAYTMQVGSVNVVPESANNMIVSLNGVIQAPISSYTVSGSTITFASNLVTGDSIDFIQILGDVLNIGTPSDSTVSLAKLSATGTKDSTTFLRGDNTFAAPPLGGITMADQWRLSANTSISGTGSVTSNWERADNTNAGFIGTGVTQSSGIFTFPSTGIYLINFKYVTLSTAGGIGTIHFIIQTTTDNSAYATVSRVSDSENANRNTNGFLQYFFDVTSTVNCKVKFGHVDYDGGSLLGNTAFNQTSAYFTRLGDT